MEVGGRTKAGQGSGYTMGEEDAGAKLGKPPSAPPGEGPSRSNTMTFSRPPQDRRWDAVAFPSSDEVMMTPTPNPQAHRRFSGGCAGNRPVRRCPGRSGWLRNPFARPHRRCRPRSTQTRWSLGDGSPARSGIQGPLGDGRPFSFSRRSSRPLSMRALSRCRPSADHQAAH